MESMSNVSVARSILLWKDILPEDVMARHFALVPEFENKYDSRQLILCKKDISYNLNFIAQAIEMQSPILFDVYIKWLKTFLAHKNVSNLDTLRSLRCMEDILVEKLGDSSREIIKPFIDSAETILLGDSQEDESFISPLQADYINARKYLDIILSGDRKQAVDFILSIVSDHASIKNIYLNILQPVQREIGRLWQTSQITVAQEHYSTSITQLTISQLYPYIFSQSDKSKKLISTCVSGELHEIGLRMLSDIFELEGWNTWYLGANMPNKDIVNIIHEISPDIIAISVTMTYHLNQVKELIGSIKNSGIKTPIMVGGYPFIYDKELWRHVGADATSVDAISALATANRLAGNL